MHWGSPFSVLGRGFLTGFSMIFKAVGVAAQLCPYCSWLSPVNVCESVKGSLWAQYMKLLGAAKMRPCDYSAAMLLVHILPPGTNMLPLCVRVADASCPCIQILICA